MNMTNNNKNHLCGKTIENHKHMPPNSFYLHAKLLFMYTLINSLSISCFFFFIFFLDTDPFESFHRWRHKMLVAPIELNHREFHQTFIRLASITITTTSTTTNSLIKQKSQCWWVKKILLKITINYFYMCQH